MKGVDQHVTGGGGRGGGGGGGGGRGGEGEGGGAPGHAGTCAVVDVGLLTAFGSYGTRQPDTIGARRLSHLTLSYTSALLYLLPS